MQRWIGIGIAAGFVVATACGGDKPGSNATRSAASEGGERPGEAAPQVYKRGDGAVSAAIGPGGGTLELASGPRVEIPAGALDHTQDVVLKEAPLTTAFSNQEHERTEGPTFVIGPALEAPPGKAIRISVPLAGYPEGWGDIALGHEYPVQQMVGADDAEHTKWQYATAKLDEGRATAELPAINGYRLQFVLSNLAAQ